MVKDFMGEEPPTAEQKRNCRLFVAVGPGDAITLMKPDVLDFLAGLTRIEAYLVRDHLCAYFGIPKEEELNYLG